jgi:hypothetical protein
VKGLTSDDRVIVNGLMTLKPDLKVIVQTSDAKPVTSLAQENHPPAER